jgi:ATP-dependent RNA helicase RhlE
MDISRVVIFGGVGQYPQVKALKNGVHIVVATPGRLLDLVKQKHVDLGGVEIFVLDEADRMLDMGFIPDIRQIIQRLPTRRQSLFFSATMEEPVVELARTLVHKPVRITIEPEKPAVELIEQKVVFVNKENKDSLLIGMLQNSELNRVIVFTQMKHMADRVQEKLEKAGIQSECIHGGKGQQARTQALRNFKTGRTRVLVATDIAARGIDVDSISHVINYDLPHEPETYIHRIGRTARAGADGDAISFCSARERDFLRAIEKLLRRPIPVDLGHGLHSDEAMNATGPEAKPLPRGGGRNRQQRQGGQGQGHKPRRFSHGSKRGPHGHRSGKPPRRGN